MKKKKTELKPLPCFRGFLAHTRGKGPASSPCKKLVAGTSPLLATFAKKSASSRQPKKVGPCDLNCPTNLDWFQCKSLLSQPVWTGGCSGKSQIRSSDKSLKPIGHVRYTNIVTWLRGFQDKLLYLVSFSLYPTLFWEFRNKRNFKKLQFWPESLGAILEY